jgi:hypothetical protein
MTPSGRLPFLRFLDMLLQFGIYTGGYMILRRFMKHVSDQNWFAVGLDVIVVVVGIFLGMQVTEWNENRKTTETFGFIHQKLVEDFTTIEEQARFRVSFHQERTENLQYLLKVIRREVNEPYDMDRLKDALTIGDANWENPRHSVVWTSLVANDQMNLIANEALRQALAEYERGLAEADGGLKSLRSMMNESRNDFFRYTEFSPDFNVQTYINSFTVTVPIQSLDLQAMKDDKGFHAAVSQYMRLQYFMTLNHQINLSNAEEVLRLLELRGKAG